MTKRIGLPLAVALLLLVAPASSFADPPVAQAGADGQPPTAPVPEVGSTPAAAVYAAAGVVSAEGTERLDVHSPAISLMLGVSIPIKGWAFVDVEMSFSEANGRSAPPLTNFGNDVTLRTFAVTASGRVGYTGKTAAVFGSAGIGLAYVTLTGGLDLYGAPADVVDSSVAPVRMVAVSFEAPTRKRGRFLVEFRYSWITVDFGSNSGGRLNAGGRALVLGWKGFF